MKYMLLMYANESEAPKTPEEQQAAAPAFNRKKLDKPINSCYDNLKELMFYN